jgi:hypothetical protein
MRQGRRNANHGAGSTKAVTWKSRDIPSKDQGEAPAMGKGSQNPPILINRNSGKAVVGAGFG